MRKILLSGIVAGITIVIGEGILNGALLKEQWDLVNSQLSLQPPSDLIVTLALAKLFILGFVLMWLYELFIYKYGAGFKSAVASGLTIAFLIWGWVLAGMLMAGYINTQIGIITFFWGLIELPLAAVLGSKLYDRLARI